MEGTSYEGMTRTIYVIFVNVVKLKYNIEI